MRECPRWFQRELTRIGGANQYNEPIFKLVWSTEPKRLVGGKFSDGYVGYRKMRDIGGHPAWALMVWESRELLGSPIRWEREYKDPETGLLDIGPYPRNGRYRLLQKFLHSEIVQQPMEKHWIGKDGTLYRDVVQARRMQTYRLEPCGFILDVMLPMLMMWRRLSDLQKIEALRQEEKLKEEEFVKACKDVREGEKLSRVMRSSQLVQKRAELIEKSLHEAMRIAAQSGLGMRIN